MPTPIGNSWGVGTWADDTWALDTWQNTTGTTLVLVISLPIYHIITTMIVFTLSLHFVTN